MKLFIIALILLFSTATLAAPDPYLMSPTEFTTFVENEIDRGLEANITIFSGYINKTYEYGASLENVTIAIQFVYCSIMWRNVHEMLTAPDKLTRDMLEAGIWRAIEGAKAHILKAGANPEKVESIMVPTLLQLSITIEASSVDINSKNIYTCTGLDLVTYIDMQLQGAQSTPPEDWTFEPIPNLNEMEPEPEIGQRLPTYNS